RGGRGPGRAGQRPAGPAWGTDQRRGRAGGRGGGAGGGRGRGGPTNGRAARRRRLGAGRGRGRGDGGPRQRPPETSGHPFPPLKRRIAADSPLSTFRRGPSPPDGTWGRRAAAGGAPGRPSARPAGAAAGHGLSATG